MEQETLTAILIFVGAVIVALIWVLDRTNKRVADSVPPDVLAILRVAVDALETLANRTPTPLDNEVVALLRDLFKDDEAEEKPVQDEA